MVVIHWWEVETQCKRTTCYLSFRKKLCVGCRFGCIQEGGEEGGENEWRRSDEGRSRWRGSVKVEVGGHSVGSAMDWAGALWTPLQRILLWSVLEERQLVAKWGQIPWEAGWDLICLFQMSVSCNALEAADLAPPSDRSETCCCGVSGVAGCLLTPPAVTLLATWQEPWHGACSSRKRACCLRSDVFWCRSVSASGRSLAPCVRHLYEQLKEKYLRWEAQRPAWCDGESTGLSAWSDVLRDTNFR